MTGLLYMTQADVAAATAAVDPVAPVRMALTLHAEGRTTLPPESYLEWKPPAGGSARSIAMTGHLEPQQGPMAGAKIINANVDNPAQGHPRASGLTLLFDPQTARPLCMMHAARISALRTAAVSVIAMQSLRSSEAATAAVIGAGNIAARHLELMLSHLSLTEVAIFDKVPGHAEALAEKVGEGRPEVAFTTTDTARDAIAERKLVVTATTTTEGYIPFDWLAPGTVLLNVSLDDARADVVRNAALLVVDDWDLVRHDERRLLGRMYRANQICGPQEDPGEDVRRVDATLGEILVGRHPGRGDDSQIALVNPFGMAIADVAYAQALFEHARKVGLGMPIPFD